MGHAGWREFVSVAATLVVLGGVPAAVAAYEKHRAGLPGARVIGLTGVNKNGVWTHENVTASNYGLGEFAAAHLVLAAGEPVLLRLTSADVTHGFYAPELGIGPLAVEPGHVVEVPFTPRTPGVYEYYCHLVCGKCHYYMRGTIEVTAGASSAAPGARPCPHHAPGPGGAAPGSLPPEPVPGQPLVDRGRLLFGSMGCTACHGEGGAGGVKNPNYVKDTVPELRTLAERMMLFAPEEAAAVVGALEARTPLESLATKPPFPAFPRFLAQYRAIRDVIAGGNEAGSKDPAGPKPPLSMPMWRNHLSDDDIDAVIAYLVSLFPWEE